jgi:hypothetical protein
LFEVGEDVAALLAQRVDHRHVTSCEPVSALASRSGGPLAPHDESPQPAFGVVVVRGHALLESVGYEGIAVRKYVGTCAADVAARERHAALEVMHEDRLEPGHPVRAVSCDDAS